MLRGARLLRLRTQLMELMQVPTNVEMDTDYVADVTVA